MDHLIMHTNNKYLRPGIAVLFTIKPLIEIFKLNSDSDEVLYFDTDTLIVGNGPNGPAIHLDQELITGESYEGTCFNNPCLIEGKDNIFKIKKIEIYKLE